MPKLKSIIGKEELWRGEGSQRLKTLKICERIIFLGGVVLLWVITAILPWVVTAIFFGL